jgi:hypothetical protein
LSCLMLIVAFYTFIGAYFHCCINIMRIELTCIITSSEHSSCMYGLHACVFAF